MVFNDLQIQCPFSLGYFEACFQALWFMLGVSREKHPALNAWACLRSQRGVATHKAQPWSLFGTGAMHLPLYSHWWISFGNCHVWLATQRQLGVWQGFVCKRSSDSDIERSLGSSWILGWYLEPSPHGVASDLRCSWAPFHWLVFSLTASHYFQGQQIGQNRDAASVCYIWEKSMYVSNSMVNWTHAQTWKDPRTLSNTCRGLLEYWYQCLYIPFCHIIIILIIIIIITPLHHITSHQISSHHVTSHHITCHHITSHAITSHHITSHSHAITSHPNKYHHITSHGTKSHHIQHLTSHHITCHHITSHHITCHHITSHQISSHDIAWYQITSHTTPHITSHHMPSHHITSHAITSHPIKYHRMTSHGNKPHHIHHLTSHYITSHLLTTKSVTSHDRCSIPTQVLRSLQAGTDAGQLGWSFGVCRAEFKIQGIPCKDHALVAGQKMSRGRWCFGWCGFTGASSMYLGSPKVNRNSKFMWAGSGPTWCWWGFRNFAYLHQ